ncbi:hypothetical protein AAFF_G00135180 [Aldrovandia affinis]|uniref:Uncharacterized protein n=1 Tax=Aldrovandia affinis TaxID=143900 RepID=A0AAD7W8Y1_9TELE|nr:hypothetical protein AAFF_G00135180 [Aldrovandia affinis]
MMSRPPSLELQHWERQLNKRLGVYAANVQQLVLQHDVQPGNADCSTAHATINPCSNCELAEEKDLRRSVVTGPVSTGNHPPAINDLTNALVLAEQQANLEIGPMFQWKQAGHCPAWETLSSLAHAVKQLATQWNSLKQHNGILYQQWVDPERGNARLQLLTPVNLCPAGSGDHRSQLLWHYRVNKTLREWFYWTCCHWDIATFCCHCDSCTAKKE